MLNLPHGLTFSDLYLRAGLLRLDAAFLDALAAADSALCERLREARAHADALAAKDESALLIALAPHLDDFIAELFGIETEVHALSARHNELAPLLQLQTPVRAAQGAAQISSRTMPRRSTACRCARELTAMFGGEVHRACIRAARDALAGGRSSACGRTRSRVALRGVGGADTRGQSACIARACSSKPRISSITSISCRWPPIPAPATPHTPRNPRTCAGARDSS